MKCCFAVFTACSAPNVFAHWRVISTDTIAHNILSDWLQPWYLTSFAGMFWQLSEFIFHVILLFSLPAHLPVSHSVFAHWSGISTDVPAHTILSNWLQPWYLTGFAGMFGNVMLTNEIVAVFIKDPAL